MAQSISTPGTSFAVQSCSSQSMIVASEIEIMSTEMEEELVDDPVAPKMN